MRCVTTIGAMGGGALGGMGTIAGTIIGANPGGPNEPAEPALLDWSANIEAIDCML